MTWPMKIILALVLIAGVFLAGYITAESLRDPGIEIIDKSQTITRWIQRPGTCDEYKKCAENPLELDGKIEKAILHAWASDGCRKAERDFALRAVAPVRKNIIQAGYTYDLFNQAHGGQVLYLRKFGRVGVGGGVAVSERATGLLGAIQYEF